MESNLRSPAASTRAKLLTKLSPTDSPDHPHRNEAKTIASNEASSTSASERIHELERLLLEKHEELERMQSSIQKIKQEARTEADERVAMERRRSREKEIVVGQELKTLQSLNDHLKDQLERQQIQIIEAKQEVEEEQKKHKNELNELKQKLVNAVEEYKIVRDLYAEAEDKLDSMQHTLEREHADRFKVEKTVSACFAWVSQLGVRSQKYENLRKIVTKIIARRFMQNWKLSKTLKESLKFIGEHVQKLAELRRGLSECVTGIRVQKSGSLKASSLYSLHNSFESDIELDWLRKVKELTQGLHTHVQKGDGEIESLDGLSGHVLLQETRPMNSSALLSLQSSLITLSETQDVLLPTIEELMRLVNSVSSLMSTYQQRNAELVHTQLANGSVISELRTKLELQEKDKAVAQNECHRWRMQYRFACRRLCESLLAKKLAAGSGKNLATIVPILSTDKSSRIQRQVQSDDVRFNSLEVQKTPRLLSQNNALESVSELWNTPTSGLQCSVLAEHTEKNDPEGMLNTDSKASKTQPILETCDLIGLRIAGYPTERNSCSDRDKLPISTSIFFTTHPGTGRRMRHNAPLAPSKGESASPYLQTTLNSSVNRSKRNQRRVHLKEETHLKDENPLSISAMIRHAGIKIAPLALSNEQSGTNTIQLTNDKQTHLPPLPKAPLKASSAPFAIRSANKNMENKANGGNMRIKSVKEMEVDVEQQKSKRGMLEFKQNSNPTRAHTKEIQSYSIRDSDFDATHNSVTPNSYADEQYSEEFDQDLEIDELAAESQTDQTRTLHNSLNGGEVKLADGLASPFLDLNSTSEPSQKSTSVDIASSSFEQEDVQSLLYT